VVCSYSYWFILFFMSFKKVGVFLCSYSYWFILFFMSFKKVGGFFWLKKTPTFLCGHLWSLNPMYLFNLGISFFEICSVDSSYCCWFLLFLVSKMKNRNCIFVAILDFDQGLGVRDGSRKIFGEKSWESGLGKILPTSTPIFDTLIGIFFGIENIVALKELGVGSWEVELF